MRVIGLTGGIATGKSTVSKQFAAKGYEVVDADEIVHELQAPGSEVLKEIEQAFGPGVLNADESLNRQQLAQMIFSDEQARQRLNEIIHPKVVLEIKERIATSRANLLFLDVPLLFEVGLDQLTDANVVVYAPPHIQLERLMRRDQIDGHQAQAKVDSQLSIDAKVKRADFVIDNGGTLAELDANVEEILETMIGGEDSGNNEAKC